MSNKVKFELNINGLRELMKSPAMKGVLEQAGMNVKSHAEGMSGGTYGYRVHDASYVSICNVYPDTPEALRDNYKNNSLLKAAGTVSTIGAKPHL